MRRTYSERPLKRHRLETPETSEEPPSPEQLRFKKPTFSFLKRPASAPLASISKNGSAKQTKLLMAGKPKRTKQMTLDLGQSMTLTCKDCGMSYTPSQPSDAWLHNKHHALKVQSKSEPSEVPLAILRLLENDNVVWTSGDKQIIRVSKWDESSKRKFAEKMLQAATEDLGAVDITPTQLWSEGQPNVERYKVFIILRLRKCVGVLLVEKLETAYEVLNASFPLLTDVSEESDATVPTTVDAVMGISRIWTHKSERRMGIATILLDVAMKNFLRYSNVEKNKVAFSQPTEQGAALARRWLGKGRGWLVYTD